MTRYAPGIDEFIARSNKVLRPDFHREPIPVQRAMYLALSDEFPFERPRGMTVTDVELADGAARVGARVYRPDDADGGCILYMHGGGFVLGSIESHDTLVAELAAKSGCTAVAVDFRPAPEHPFPAAVEDCYTALRAVHHAADALGVDSRRIAVAGDSSGANLAVVTCLVARDRGGPSIAAQVLVSPVLDFARWRAGGDDAPLLSSDEMVFFTHAYAGDSRNIEHRYLSPLLSDDFHDLPPAYVMAAEADSLRVDAEAYASRLTANGIPVELVVEPGFVHACLRARGVSAAVADAFDRIAAAAARLLGAPARAESTRA